MGKLLQDDETGLPTERLDPTALAWIAERASPEVAARVATASEAAKYKSPETKFELQKNSSLYLAVYLANLETTTQNLKYIKICCAHISGTEAVFRI